MTDAAPDAAALIRRQDHELDRLHAENERLRNEVAIRDARITALEADVMHARMQAERRERTP